MCMQHKAWRENDFAQIVTKKIGGVPPIIIINFHIDKWQIFLDSHIPSFSEIKKKPLPTV